MNRRAISSMFAVAFVGAALLIGAAGPVAADDEAPKESIINHGGGSAGNALAAPALLAPCPGTETEMEACGVDHYFPQATTL